MEAEENWSILKADVLEFIVRFWNRAVYKNGKMGC
jgi:hypothetical protein